MAGYEPHRRAIVSGLAGWALAGSCPAVIASGRPMQQGGVKCGSPGPDRGLIWARADRPARLEVEWATTDRFQNAQRISGPVATAATDFTARVPLTDLPAGQTICYRTRWVDASNPRAVSAPVEGRFRTPDGRRPLRMLWSGDTCGQGWGINPDIGGLPIFKAMAARDPDLFIHCGDTIYADGPIKPRVVLPDGRLWRNVTSPAKDHVAVTLEDFRGNHRYTLLDEGARAFNAQVAQVVQWDDHETINNWFPGEVLEPRYGRERRASVRAQRARRAFMEYHPLPWDPATPGRIWRSVSMGPLAEVFLLDMRTHRGPNSPNRQRDPGPETAFLGSDQVRWLKQALRRSTAQWKIIAADMPLGLMIADGPEHYEGLANGDGPPLGRELELADLLATLKRDQVKNVVWITADVHYTAAHHYDPERARRVDFDPFWEFVSGPMHAGTFGPNRLDPTFGPEVRFQQAPPPGKGNLSPLDGQQFFGELEVDPATSTLSVTLRDLAGTALFAITLPHVS